MLPTQSGLLHVYRKRQPTQKARGHAVASSPTHTYLRSGEVRRGKKVEIVSSNPAVAIIKVSTRVTYESEMKGLVLMVLK